MKEGMRVKLEGSCAILTVEPDGRRANGVYIGLTDGNNGYIPAECLLPLVQYLREQLGKKDEALASPCARYPLDW